MPEARLIGMSMNEHSGDIAAAIIIGAAIRRTKRYRTFGGINPP